MKTHLARKLVHDLKQLVRAICKIWSSLSTDYAKILPIISPKPSPRMIDPPKTSPNDETLERQIPRTMNPPNKKSSYSKNIIHKKKIQGSYFFFLFGKHSGGSTIKIFFEPH